MKLFVSKIKKFFKPYPKIFKIISLINRLLRIDYAIYKYKRNKYRTRCYNEYEQGQRIVKKKIGNITSYYEAVSPKNYWHLSTGSQNEDSFADLIFDNCILEGMTIFDIGGHTGQYTIPFAKKVGHKGFVYVFEPEQIGYKAIKRNIKINELNNVEILDFAISNKNQDINFYIRPDKDTHSIFKETGSPSLSGKQNVITVKSYSIDGLLKNNIIKSIPDFIKIDTEGSEIEIIKGAKQTLPFVKLLLIEIHADELIRSGYNNPYESVEIELNKTGFIHQRYLDNIHIIASRKKEYLDFI